MKYINIFRLIMMNIYNILNDIYIYIYIYILLYDVMLLYAFVISGGYSIYLITSLLPGFPETRIYTT